MARLSERDLKATLELVYDAGSLSGDQPFPIEFLARLATLIPADAIVAYREALFGRPCRFVEEVEIPVGGIPREIQEAGGHFSKQDPIRHCVDRDQSHAYKLSDFLSRRAKRKLDFYWYVWKPLGIDDSLRLWLPAPARRMRAIYLERGKRDFTERDRAILELLRPSLIRIHRAALLRREARAPVPTTLTPREREILRWIARGKTSREIAAILVVSPHTVRKHVEHILEKLDAPSRSAAVARAFPALAGGS